MKTKLCHLKDPSGPIKAVFEVTSGDCPFFCIHCNQEVYLLDKNFYHQSENNCSFSLDKELYYLSKRLVVRYINKYIFLERCFKCPYSESYFHSKHTVVIEDFMFNNHKVDIMILTSSGIPECGIYLRNVSSERVKYFRKNGVRILCLDPLRVYKSYQEHSWFVECGHAEEPCSYCKFRGVIRKKYSCILCDSLVNKDHIIKRLDKSMVYCDKCFGECPTCSILLSKRELRIYGACKICNSKRLTRICPECNERMRPENLSEWGQCYNCRRSNPNYFVG
jgi:hypothetical protein